MRDAIRHMLTGFGQLVADPDGFAVLLLYATLWFLLDRDRLEHAVATVATLRDPGYPARGAP